MRLDQHLGKAMRLARAPAAERAFIARRLEKRDGPAGRVDLECGQSLPPVAFAMASRAFPMQPFESTLTNPSVFPNVFTI